MEKWIETGKIENGDLGRIYELLSAPLPQEAAQHTQASKTKKGYDTTGYRPQYVVNRMNEVCGLGGWRILIVEKTLEKIAFGSGEGWEAVMTVTAEIGNWVFDPAEPEHFGTLAERSNFGGQRSRTPEDALKGALMAATSKVLSGFGVGKLAYEGGLDEALKRRRGAAPDPTPPGQSPEDKEPDQKPKADPHNRTISSLTELEKQKWETDRLNKALEQFATLEAGDQFWGVLKRFRADSIGAVSVKAIENVRKALLDKFEEIKSQKAADQAAKD